jgi:hypothetical protein
MKKLACLFMALLLLTPLNLIAASVNQSIKVEWQQEASDYPLIASWTLYWADSEVGPWQPALTIDHVGSDPLNSAQGTLTIIGNPGQSITKYFRLTAWSRTSTGETAPSNVAQATFKIPDVGPKVPSSLTIQVIIQAQ